MEQSQLPSVKMPSVRKLSDKDGEEDPPTQQNQDDDAADQQSDNRSTDRQKQQSLLNAKEAAGAAL